MSSRFLQVFADNATFVVTGTLPFLQSRRADPSQVRDVCTQYRRRGIARFLQTARPDVLQQDLQRSGTACAAYLGWADETVKVASQAGPFYDAIASGDARTAKTIAELSGTTLKPDYEYEDDFLYTRILMSRFHLGGRRADLEALLKRYELLLDGAEDPRFLICRAFLAERPEEYEAALEQLIAMREDHYARGIEEDAILEEEWATEGKIFVEGLALVRLARTLGFPTQKEYLFIPSIALAQGAIAFDGASWMSA